MSKTSLILMDDSGLNVSLKGDPVRADGWWGYTDGKSTVSIHVQEFTGRVAIEATLASEPTEDDWFPVWLLTTTPYIDMKNESSSQAFTFEGNFTYVRAILDRSYIQMQPTTNDQIQEYGKVRKILLNH